MAQLVMKVDLKETLRRMMPGEELEIDYREATSSAIRQMAHLLHKNNGADFTVSTLGDPGTTKVKRLA